MNAEKNRLLLRFEQLLRETNREIINPEINVLSIEDLKPVVEMVARARAAYLKTLYELSLTHKKDQSLPTSAEMETLQGLRTRFLDLADGAKSIEVAIQREYLDIKH
jgi:hypothetical protein